MSSCEYATFDDVVTFDLFEKWDIDEQSRKGGLKTYEAEPDSGLIYNHEKSGYLVTVERVLAVDGYEKKPTGDDNDGQKMTLCILKIVVMCHKPDDRIRSVAATLSVKNSKTGPKANPTLEAWAPFRRLQLTAPQKVASKQTDRKAASLGASLYGAEAHAELSREKEIAFEHIYYDTALASAIMDPGTKQRCGVQWYMAQSKMQTTGVPPELFAAVLFTRDTDDEYVMGFDIDIHGGTSYDFRNKMKRVFGLKPGHTKPFLVTPSRHPAVRGGEGRDFLRGVVSDSLGNLRAKDDSTGLEIVRRELHVVSADRQGADEDGSAGQVTNEEGGGGL
ncbi:hypothetical protein NPX13_g3086 [Xylaria arbuscula]|uniref:Uncharacterized protein n=1 Tax=Xylaria arbuscula TaxID=114810 RepID=A0A9W8TPP7_9PEZI|nr:hypothetical protein NPX13_g3086 [Xylaria arbuscula]